MTYGHSTTKVPPPPHRGNSPSHMLEHRSHLGSPAQRAGPGRTPPGGGESFQTAGETGAIRSRYKTPL